MNFQTPGEDGYALSNGNNQGGNLAAYLKNNAPSALRNLTEGNFGYSLSRPTANKEYFYKIFDDCVLFNCGIEGWHTETGPGVFEAVRIPAPSTSLLLTVFFVGSEILRSW